MPNLILPRAEIIDSRALLRAVATDVATAPDAQSARKLVVEHLAAAMTKGNAALAAAFAAKPTKARPLISRNHG